MDRPAHQVRITRPYYLGVHEVTRGQFAQFVSETGYKSEAERSGGPAGGIGSNGELVVVHGANWRKPGFEQNDSHPVVDVSWSDAVEFCRWLSRKDGRTYRLPTEAEWEYACRAGTTTHFSTGNSRNDIFKAGNSLDKLFREHFHLNAPDPRPADGYVFTAPVGSYPPNSFGLFDMHGNAWEWTQDWFGPYSAAAATDPTGPATGTRRVARGGASKSRRRALPRGTLCLPVILRPTWASALPARSPSNRPSSPGTVVRSGSGFVSLFNGRDLSGWKTEGGKAADWRVEKGILTADAFTSPAFLFSERDDFKNFHLLVERGSRGMSSAASRSARKFPLPTLKTKLRGRAIASICGNRGSLSRPAPAASGRSATTSMGPRIAGSAALSSSSSRESGSQST